MASTKQPNFLLLLFILICAAHVIHGVSGSRTQVVLPYPQRVYHSTSGRKLFLQVGSKGWMDQNLRRLMIGSVAPTCTYNECRGCKYKCRAEQVPVEGNDPINSAYHYRCVCHR
ncbi:unnamed protein product [Ilex paraguariensis]|uniref:Stomagen C-terminal domain-containing protein n=1 Tax=Ilex paraguariensis TaxID=185542 RepID=A0ABC8RCZ5_9AQUA